MEQITTIALWAFGGLIIALAAIIWYLITRSIESQDKLSESVNKLQITLTGMNGIILSIQSEGSQIQLACKERHERINEEIKDVWCKLDGK